MAERQEPPIEIIHPVVEILPSDHSESRSTSAESSIWLTFDSHGGTRRVVFAKPGPIATLLIAIALGVLLIVSVVLALGLLALFLSLSAVAMAGLFLVGFFQWARNRLR